MINTGCQAKHSSDKNGDHHHGVDGQASLESGSDFVMFE